MNFFTTLPKLIGHNMTSPELFLITKIQQLRNGLYSPTIRTLFFNWIRIFQKLHIFLNAILIVHGISSNRYFKGFQKFFANEENPLNFWIKISRTIITYPSSSHFNYT